MKWIQLSGFRFASGLVQEGCLEGTPTPIFLNIARHRLARLLNEEPPQSLQFFNGQNKRCSILNCRR